MYRNPKEYEDVAKTIIDIYVDYGIKSFPIDEKEVCKKMGVSLVPYSKHAKREKELLLKKSRFGFFLPSIGSTPPTIYYNDEIASIGSVRFTIFHEIKHYVYEDTDDSKDDLADYFARYFMCPIPDLVKKDITAVSDIVLRYNISEAAAKNVSKNVCKRKEKYGVYLFDYEVKLIEHLASA